MTASDHSASAISTEGAWQVGSDGQVQAFGGASSFGSLSGTLNEPIVGMASTPDGRGYWLTASDGGVFALGDAAFYGSLGNIHLNRPIVGMAATPDGHGYWLVASDGGVFAAGNAGFYGSLGNIHLNQPIVGMASTPDGRGHWLVASDGGVFAAGDARFYGSLGNLHLSRPIVGIASTPDGHGYWLVASDGGVFTLGDARFFGSAGSLRLSQPVVGMATTPDGQGYWLTAADGSTHSYGDATPIGLVGSSSGSIVGIATAKTATQIPATTTAPSTSSTNDPFVTVCGTQLCLRGQPWYMSGGTAYGHVNDPNGEAALLAEGNLNTSELVNFDSDFRTMSDTEAPTTWNQVETYIGDMAATGHHLMLNLSEFFAAMERAGMNPYSPTAGGGTNFSYQEAYLTFVADQSVDGVPNKDNPTIAKVELWAEPVTPTGEDCLVPPVRCRPTLRPCSPGTRR